MLYIACIFCLLSHKCICHLFNKKLLTYLLTDLLLDKQSRKLGLLFIIIYLTLFNLGLLFIIINVKKT